jgi:hypothetical protein
VTTAELFRPHSIAAVPSARAFPGVEAAPGADCAERFQLREEYIRRLGEFNETAARHRMVVQAGMAGPVADRSWRSLQDACAASRAAWARYRKHLAAHACKRPGALTAAA